MSYSDAVEVRVGELSVAYRGMYPVGNELLADFEKPSSALMKYCTEVRPLFVIKTPCLYESCQYTVSVVSITGAKCKRLARGPCMRCSSLEHDGA
jgi:hypothetical protein